MRNKDCVRKESLQLARGEALGGQGGGGGLGRVQKGDRGGETERRNAWVCGKPIVRLFAYGRSLLLLK